MKYRYIVLFLLLFVPFFIGKAYAQDTTAVTIIGDSLTVRAEDNLRQLLPNATIDAVVGRPVSSQWSGGENGIAVLNRLKKSGTLAPTVIFALGTNGGITQNDIDTIINTASPSNIIFMTVYLPTDNPNYAYMETSNRLVKQAFSAHPGKVFVADWNGLFSNNLNSYLDPSDPQHLHEVSPAGTQAFANLFVSTISSAGNSSSTPNANTSTDTNTSLSNCVFTKIGTPPVGYNPTMPPDCATSSSSIQQNAQGSLNDVLSWALKISTQLRPGANTPYYCNMEADITNGSYSAVKRACASSNGEAPDTYWCTDLVIDSYNLAGLTTVPNQEFVPSMIDAWKTAGGGLKYYDYTDSATQATVLTQIRPGFAIMFLPKPPHTDKEVSEHVEIIHTVTLDSYGNGSITTYSSNSLDPFGGNYQIHNFNIIPYNSSLIIVAGFGGAVTSTNTTNPTNKPIIVLDPGHSWDSIRSTDPTTGLLDYDYKNSPEIQEVFTIATQVKQQLESDGYTVIMTKNAVTEDVSLRHRADIANNAHANLAVSIHDDHTASWDTFAQIYLQNVGLYRVNISGNQVPFKNADVARKSQEYGQIFAQERGAAESHPVTITSICFNIPGQCDNNRPGLAPGNITEVELFANVPWVYNEVGGIGMGQTELSKYAQGLINGIEKSIPKN